MINIYFSVLDLRSGIGYSFGVLFPAGFLLHLDPLPRCRIGVAVNLTLFSTLRYIC